MGHRLQEVHTAVKELLVTLSQSASTKAPNVSTLQAFNKVVEKSKELQETVKECTIFGLFQNNYL
jgi:hypothetical protein